MQLLIFLRIEFLEKYVVYPNFVSEDRAHYPIYFLCYLMLCCSGGGNPAPELVWYFKGSLWAGRGEVVEAVGARVPNQVIG